MSAIQGVKVTGIIVPSDTLDTYAVIDPIYGIDGLRNISGGVNDLNLITTDRRRAGMLVGVNNGSDYYKLNPPPWNNTISDWSLFSLSGGSGASTFTGGTISGSTIFTNGLTADTISATTYYNLPLDVYVTGSSLNFGNYDFSLVRNDGMSITTNLGIFASDVTVTGGTYDVNTGSVTFINNSGGTFIVTGFASGLTDTYRTGGTYSNGTANFTKTDSSVYSVSGFSKYFVSGSTPTESLNNGDRWFNTVDGVELVYFNDGDSNESVEANIGAIVETNGVYLPVTGGELFGPVISTDGITASTFSSTTIETNTFFSDNLSATTISATTIETDTFFSDNLSATTISATTYLNLPSPKYFVSGSTPTGIIMRDGDRWFNTTDGIELIYFTDAYGSQWIQNQ